MREWSALRKLMLTKGATGAPLIEYTATGNTLSFNTNKAKPLKSLTIPWTPVQSGIGDPSPSNVRPISGVSAVNVWRTGKNLIDNTKRYMASGHVLFIGAEDDNYRVYLKAGTYRLTVVYAEGKGSAGYYRRDGDSATRLWQSGSNTGTFTLSSDSYCNLYLYGSSLESADVTSFMLTSGSDEATYEAYTGTTKSIVFPALGKNLLDITQTSKVVPGAQGSTITIANGVISIDAVANSARSYVVFSQTFPAGTYTIQAQNSGAVSMPRLLCSKEFSGASLNTYYGMYMKQLTANELKFTVSESCVIGLVLSNSAGEAGSPGTLYDIMLNTGESAQTYEPYTNTVYGGSLDVVSGVLTVTWFGVNANTLTWNTTSQSANGVFSSRFPYDQKMGNTRNRLICDKYITALPDQGIASMADYAVKGYNNEQYAKNVYIKDSRYTTKEDFSANVDALIVYELAEAQTIQLSATQISALLGDNVIWSDTNGTNTAIYFKKG